MKPKQIQPSLKPLPIQENPVVQVVFPSGSCKEHQGAISEGIQILEAYGCTVRLESHRIQNSWRGYLSEMDHVREAELFDALSDPSVDIVWFGRGGSGCNRITPRIIERAKDLDPKIVIGFSDATSVLIGLAQRLGWTCYHGPVITTIGRDNPQTDLRQIFQFLSGRKKTLSLDQSLADINIRGRLLGGNLTVLASMIGTRYEPLAEPNSIWLLEDVGEAPYRIDRSFRQLVDAGIFNGANAIWLGDFAQQDLGQRAIEKLIKEDAPCPVYTLAPAGHEGPLALLPMGSDISIKSGKLTSEWVAL